MSVGTRRLAAAQRTAVGRSPSRARRLAAWIVIVPALALFSFSVIASAAGYGKTGLAEAAKQVIPPPSVAGEKHDGGVVVVVDSPKQDDGNPLSSLLGSGHGKEVCWISASGLARVSRVYRTTTTTITIGKTSYRLVTVFGADEKTLLTLLGSSKVTCHLVGVAHVYFLPFDPNLS